MVQANKKQSLTRRQREIYDFLRDKIMNRGYGPTVREIGTHFNIRSPNGVMCHLKALERKGLIIREQNMSRAIQLAEGAQGRQSLRLLGTAAAGSPFRSAPGPDESVSFSSLFDGTDLACVRVSGSGFLSLQIADGDYLIVDRSNTDQAGSLVAAMDSRNCLTLCTIQPGTEQLVSALHNGSPAGPCQVLGAVRAVVRNFAAA